MEIAQPSVMSLMLETSVRQESLAIGTGFLVDAASGPHLITNRHNLAGRRTDDNTIISPTGACPDVVQIWHLADSEPVSWRKVYEPLYDSEDRPQWLEHPEYGRRVDVVALPLTQIESIKCFPYSMDRSERSAEVSVADELSIIGFPFGISGEGRLGIWSRGTVASEMDVDLGGLPLYLIDSRTRPGQSGSPVVFYSRGGMVRHSRGIDIGRRNVFELKGIYSGRIHPESDLGMVWKVEAIRDVIERGIRPQSN